MVLFCKEVLILIEEKFELSEGFFAWAEIY
jgi:hypothetical protein